MTGTSCGRNGRYGKSVPEHQQRVAVLHRPVAGARPDESGHADVVRIVVLDELLPAQRVQHRGLECAGDRDQLVVSTGTAGTGEDGHAAGPVENLRGGGQGVVIGPDDRVRLAHRPCLPCRGAGAEKHLTGNDDHGDPAPFECGAHRDLEDTGKLLGNAHQLAVDAALSEDLLRMGLLVILTANLFSGDVRGDREHGYAASLRVVQTVDEMKVARTAARGDRPRGHR